MREVVLDTETTGLDPADGHRIVEIACVELLNLMPTGRELHFYCNPGRDVPADAVAVHGLTLAFLKDKPAFEDEVERLQSFVAGARLVAHNAEFDVRFLDWELERCGRGKLGLEVIDTLGLARQKYPGAPVSLDALCRRFGIDLGERVKHGALIDTRLLAKVYLELMGGEQPDLGLAGVEAVAVAAAAAAARTPRPARPHAASEAELLAHEAMLRTIEAPLWLNA